MTDVTPYYKALAELNKRGGDMSDYEQGRRDCELGVPHYDKSEAYTKGYGDKYAEEQCNAAK